MTGNVKQAKKRGIWNCLGLQPGTKNLLILAAKELRRYHWNQHVGAAIGTFFPSEGRGSQGGTVVSDSGQHLAAAITIFPSSVTLHKHRDIVLPSGVHRVLFTFRQFGERHAPKTRL